MSAIVDCMRKRNISITQQNYVAIAFLGEKMIDDLGPEELAELPDGFEKWPETENGN